MLMVENKKKLPDFELENKAVVDLQVNSSGAFFITIRGCVDNFHELTNSYDREYLIRCLLVYVLLVFLSSSEVNGLTSDYMKNIGS